MGRCRRSNRPSEHLVDDEDAGWLRDNTKASAMLLNSKKKVENTAEKAKTRTNADHPLKKRRSALGQQQQSRQKRIEQFFGIGSSKKSPKKRKNSEVVFLGESSKPASSSTPGRKKRRREAVLSPSDSIFNKSFEEIKRTEKPEGVVVVRKKDERRKLHGHECKCCEKYYDSLNLDPAERAKRVDAVSRHRTTYKPFVRAKTPEGFWDVDMPCTPETNVMGGIKRGGKEQDEAKRKLF